ncbi:hypothetical protein ACFX2I_010722 [Malus domestica]
MPAAASLTLPLLPLIPAATATNAITRSSSPFRFRSATTSSNVITITRCRATRGRQRSVVVCCSASNNTSKENASSSTCNITDFDLYDLMGIDSSCDRSQIKTAYRNLQKRCHPDIAGPAGHDMAIILNEAYALLSDPNSRSAYDKEQSKIAQLRGYTGKPIYSAWFGSESEERAVFVDEVKCIGCLKCALCAEKTFAIESVYGRARVVGQWADPESKIQEAIQACPVDCISIVERENLAALEFLMSKQPRGSVRIGMGNAAGERVANIFVDVKKFQNTFQDAKDKASKSSTDLQSEARLSAIQAIRSISNWLYWKTPYSSYSNAAGAKSTTPLLLMAGKSQDQPNIGKLRDAAAARKQARNHQTTRPLQSSSSNNEEDYYWMPLANALPAASASSTQNDNSNSSTTTVSASSLDEWKQTNNNAIGDNGYRSQVAQRRPNPIRWLAPMVPATLMAAVVGLQGGDRAAVSNGGGIKEHIGGSFALEIVNSSWLQILLVAITWYIIGMIIVGIADAFQSKKS